MEDNIADEFKVQTNCIKFSGYKPCAPFKLCDQCNDPIIAKEQILIIGLEALGSVLMTTSILPSIRNKFPYANIIWLTMPQAVPLLENNPYINRVLAWNDLSRMLLQLIEFDLVYSLDKSLHGCAFANMLHAGAKYGFGLSTRGVIIPLNKGAYYNYRLGLDDKLKFYNNRLSYIEILHETIELPPADCRYILQLSKEELGLQRNWTEMVGLSEGDIVVGFNTGCSELYPNKKLTVEQHVFLIRSIYEFNPNAKIILLGGREDTERNDQIYRLCDKKPINTPTTEGLRRGIVYMNVADIVVSGDSLGMHIAIGLGKYVIAWFGLSCAQEIDLFGRGNKIISTVPCAPCWRNSCEDLRCISEFPQNELANAIIEAMSKCKSNANKAFL